MRAVVKPTAPLALVRCAIGIIAIGLSIPYVASVLAGFFHFAWTCIPERGSLVGANGYIDLFFANFGRKPDFDLLRRVMCYSGPSVLLCILGCLMLRGGKLATAIVRRAA